MKTHSLDQIVSFEELLLSQVGQQEALTRVACGERGYLRRKNFWRV